MTRLDAIRKRAEAAKSRAATLKDQNRLPCVEQRHLEEGTSERAYWHHGYAMGSVDALEAVNIPYLLELVRELRRVAYRNGLLRVHNGNAHWGPVNECIDPDCEAVRRALARCDELEEG